MSAAFPFDAELEAAGFRPDGAAGWRSRGDRLSVDPVHTDRGRAYAITCRAGDCPSAVCAESPWGRELELIPGTARLAEAGAILRRAVAHAEAPRRRAWHGAADVSGVYGWGVVRELRAGPTEAAEIPADERARAAGELWALAEEVAALLRRHDGAAVRVERGRVVGVTEWKGA